MRVRPSSGRGTRRGPKIGSRRKRLGSLRLRGSGRVAYRLAWDAIRCISKGGAAATGQREKRRRRERRRLRHVRQEACPHPPEVPRGKLHPQERKGMSPTLHRAAESAGPILPVLLIKGVMLQSWSEVTSRTVPGIIVIQTALGFASKERVHHRHPLRRQLPAPAGVNLHRQPPLQGAGNREHHRPHLRPKTVQGVMTSTEATARIRAGLNVRVQLRQRPLQRQLCLDHAEALSKVAFLPRRGIPADHPVQRAMNPRCKETENLQRWRGRKTRKF